MRSFEFAREIVKTDKGIEFGVDPITGEINKAYPCAQIPMYATSHSAGADFFCAKEVVIPSIWSQFIKRIIPGTWMLERVESDETVKKVKDMFAPTFVHTGIKSCMGDDEVLELYNRSSNPIKLGLILANSVGVVDSDYYNNTENDGEIMFAFYNVLPFDITIKAGDRIGQGVFKKVLRPVEGLRVRDVERSGGYGSTGVR